MVVAAERLWKRWWTPSVGFRGSMSWAMARTKKQALSRPAVECRRSIPFPIHRSGSSNTCRMRTISLQIERRRIERVSWSAGATIGLRRDTSSSTKDCSKNRASDTIQLCLGREPTSPDTGKTRTALPRTISCRNGKTTPISS